MHPWEEMWVPPHAAHTCALVVTRGDLVTTTVWVWQHAGLFTPVALKHCFCDRDMDAPTAPPG